MNYIREINAFYDWLETNSIPDSAIVLWHALMHINNKAGWVTEFAVAISTLETKTRLKKDAIVRARHRLQQSGRITFRSRSGQQSAVYSIIPFEASSGYCVGLNDTNCDTNCDTKCNTNRALSATQTASINKPNNTKQRQNNNKPPISPFESYTQNAELLQRLKDFLEMRKAIKKPMTDRAKSELLVKLDTLARTDEEKISVLEQSIFNSWQGVFPLRPEDRAIPKATKADQNKQVLEAVFGAESGGT